MKSIDDVGLEDVTAVYSGPEGNLWAPLMGEQIHLSGSKSSVRGNALLSHTPGVFLFDPLPLRR